MALHPELDKHLRSIIPASGYSVSGTSATVSATLDHHRLEELLDKAFQTGHDLKMVAGTLTLAPR